MTKVTDNHSGDGVIWRANTQHILGHIDCPACLEVKSMLTCSISADLSFTRAAEIFMQLRSVAATPGAISARYVRKNTEKGYKRHKESLELFFVGMTLGEIRWFHMRAYQQARVAGAPPFVRYRRPQDAKPQIKRGIIIAPAKGKTPCPAKPQQVNQELAFLKRLKLLAGCWTDEDDKYFEHLQEDESEIPRALTPDEQARWLDISRCQERWNLVHWYSILAFHTCASTNELRALRLGDINIFQRLISVPWPGAKNKYRHRDIAIESADALWALERLIARARDLGATDPQHYLFPFRTCRGEWKPERPASGSFLKKTWEEVRAASGLTWFRPYDTRHTAATRLAEDGKPIDIILARMGHVDDRMRRHYTHISVQAQRRWLRQPESYTQHMYAPSPAQMPPPQYHPYAQSSPTESAWPTHPYPQGVSYGKLSGL
jgi:integrase